jgi:hypothetical protein
VVDRGRDRAETPAGAVENDRIHAVGEPPADGITCADAGGSKAARDRRDQFGHRDARPPFTTGVDEQVVSGRGASENAIDQARSSRSRKSTVSGQAVALASLS